MVSMELTQKIKSYDHGLQGLSLDLCKAEINGSKRNVLVGKVHSNETIVIDFESSNQMSAQLRNQIL